VLIFGVIVFIIFCQLQIDELFKEMDTDGSGNIEFAEVKSISFFLFFFERFFSYAFFMLTVQGNDVSDESQSMNSDICLNSFDNFFLSVSVCYGSSLPLAPIKFI
jgi:hypothetical protein